MSESTTAVLPEELRTATRPKGRRWWSGYFTILEFKRDITNVSTLIFCFGMPIAFYFMFGAAFGDQQFDRINANAWIMECMIIYGACMTSASMGIMVANERPTGWNRQLRLTPLSPWAYVLAKAVVAFLTSVASVLLLLVIAVAWGKASMPISMWIIGPLVALIGSITFTGLALVVGMSMKPQMATGTLVPALLFFSFLSGLFNIPVSGKAWEVVGDIVPMGGIVNIANSLFGASSVSSGFSAITWYDWLNFIGWLVVFIAAGMWTYARDTKRQ